MLVDERWKLLIFMNVSFDSIKRVHLVHRRPAVEAYRDRGKLATLTSGQNKKGTPVIINLGPGRISRVTCAVHVCSN